MKKNLVFLLAVLIALPMLVLAHPGHGATDGYTIIHYITEPAHIVFQLIILSLVAYIVVLKRRIRKQRN